MSGPVDPTQLTYLVVDDSRFSRTLIKNALGVYGVNKFVECGDAVEALTLLGDDSIDFILVDMDMPVISGSEFTRMVRRGGPGIKDPEIPIVIISAHGQREEVLEARNAGVHEYVTKPFSPDALYRRIYVTLNYPRPFIRCKTYIGPDRRALDIGPPEGSDRRQDRAAREAGDDVRIASFDPRRMARSV